MNKWTRSAGWAAAMLFSMGTWGCGGAADVAGTYSIGITNKDNGCGFDNWTVGQMTSNVGLVITQSGDKATATVQGVAGAFYTLVLGTASFTGTVDGNALDLTIFGTRQATKNSCAYTVNAEVHAAISGDLLSGTIDYKAATNGSPDCGSIQDCTSSQAFNGTRPPK